MDTTVAGCDVGQIASSALVIAMLVDKYMYQCRGLTVPRLEKSFMLMKFFCEGI